jgi:hypothetical protein
MNKILEQTIIITISLFVSGCVAVESPKPSTPRPALGTPVRTVEYGYPPQNYRSTIKNYFANKIKRADKSTYKFSAPQKAYKRKALAYGGDIEWRGWLVDVSITTPNRVGRLMSPKYHMVLFNDSVIVEDILGHNHKLLTRVGR